MASAAPGLPSRLRFFAEFLKSPFEVGSPIATFQRTIARLMVGVEWRNVRRVVEYGPGTGEFTRYILRHAPAEAEIVGIESDEDLCHHLRRTISDNRLVLHCASATEAHSLLGSDAEGSVDFILSGLPFSSLDPAQRDKIVADAAGLLKPEGLFLVYQVRRAIEPHLAKYFSNVRRSPIWLNLPPYQLYYCSNVQRSGGSRADQVAALLASEISPRDLGGEQSSAE